MKLMKMPAVSCKSHCESARGLWASGKPALRDSAVLFKLAFWALWGVGGPCLCLAEVSPCIGGLGAHEMLGGKGCAPCLGHLLQADAM